MEKDIRVRKNQSAQRSVVGQWNSDYHSKGHSQSRGCLPTSGWLRESRSFPIRPRNIWFSRTLLNSHWLNIFAVSIKINILDVHDNNPVFDDTENFYFVETTNKTETVFGTIRATDPDLGEVIAYSISSDGWCANLTINPNTGRLKTTDIIDHEVTDTIQCVITAVDNGTTPCSSVTTVNAFISFFRRLTNIANG